MKNKTKNTGFSLIETVIYSSVLVLVFILSANSLILLNKTFNNNKLLGRINISAETIMERMTREIRRASSVVVGSSVFNSSPGRLVLSAVNDPTTTDFYLNGGALMVAENGGAGDPLTVSGVSVSSLIFRATTTSAGSIAIKIEMELNDARGNYQKNKKFYDTVILRGSY